MKTNLNHNSWRHLMSRGNVLMIATLLTAAGWCSSCHDDYDLDEKLPPNFGSNLMTHLEGNNFTTYAQLAKDLDYVNALSGVSLKTLLAADDEAFARFFKNNAWGVKSYSELTTAQKKLLFYNSMLDNSLQVLNLSSTSGLQEVAAGNAMRRDGSGSVYDSVPVITPEEMPDNNSFWTYYRDNSKSIVCMKDMTSKPIMFFIEPFLKAKKITNSDVEFLYNYTFSRNAGDATIGSTYVAEGNIRCPNGFIHRMNDVLMPLDNMAEIIRKNKNMSIFSRALERFSAPFYAGDDATRDYNYEYKKIYGDTYEIDSLFEKRYFSDRSKGGTELHTPDHGNAVESWLKFDPGWNSFHSDQKGAISTTVSMQSNMGVMIVPSDSAMNKYWNGEGKALKDAYGTYDNVPNHIWAQLINNGMLNSFINSVPSKFSGIVNSNQDNMGLKDNDTSPIDSVFLGCNGAIYMTNKVFPPTDFISVLFPTLVNSSMSIARWFLKLNAAGQCPGYDSYLNSLDSYYAFIVPTNEALKNYLLPNGYPYAGGKNILLKFYYDDKALTDETRVWASTWELDMNDPESVPDSISKITSIETIVRYLREIFDNHIIIGKRDKKSGNILSDLENGHQYYRTKNGGIVEVKKEGSDVYVRSSLQIDRDKWLKVSQVYDQSAVGNGKTFVLGGEDAEPLMTTNQSVLNILQSREEFSEFFGLLRGASNLISLPKDYNMGSGSGNISTFNNFNYTVYVPTNESLKAVFADKKNYALYTWEEISKYEEADESTWNPGETEKSRKDSIDRMKNRLETFIRYHIQDNLLLIGLDYANDGGGLYDENGNPLGGNDDFEDRPYETASMNKNNRFYTVSVTSDGTAGTLKVKDDFGNVRNVVKKQDNQGRDLYNLSAREYEFGGVTVTSFAAIHLIDGPLFPNTKK